MRRSDRYANPADDPEAHPFLKAIASSNGNSLPRMVFADWLDENGYTNAAAGQRWAAKHGKQPNDPRHPLGNQFIPEVWHVPANLNGMEPRHTDRFYYLPRPFQQVNPIVGLHFGPDARHASEHEFLGTSHQLSWHPETGEPQAP